MLLLKDKKKVQMIFQFLFPGGLDFYCNVSQMHRLSIKVFCFFFPTSALWKHIARGVNANPCFIFAHCLPAVMPKWETPLLLHTMHSAPDPFRCYTWGLEDRLIALNIKFKTCGCGGSSFAWFVVVFLGGGAREKGGWIVGIPFKGCIELQKHRVKKKKKTK